MFIFSMKLLTSLRAVFSLIFHLRSLRTFPSEMYSFNVARHHGSPHLVHLLSSKWVTKRPQFCINSDRVKPYCQKVKTLQMFRISLSQFFLHAFPICLFRKNPLTVFRRLTNLDSNSL